ICTILVADAGTSSPHRSSRRRCIGTARLASRISRASSARCLRPPRVSGVMPSIASSGPRTRNSMGIANATGGFTERLLPANRDRVSYALLMHPTKEFAVTQVIETVRNGVDTEQMYGTLDAIKAKPELGVFQFRASNRWLGGA